VPVFGIGASLNLTLLTRGKDAGLHGNLTGSVRVGAEVGASVNLSEGWYNGDPRNATYNSLMGMGADVSAQVGVGIGAWESFSRSPMQPSWVGGTIGVGPGLGGSVGFTGTTPLW
jgi:hypothetical protein